MKKFVKLSRAEMKNVLGGVSAPLPTCAENDCGYGDGKGGIVGCPSGKNARA